MGHRRQTSITTSSLPHALTPLGLTPFGALMATLILTLAQNLFLGTLEHLVALAMSHPWSFSPPSPRGSLL